MNFQFTRTPNIIFGCGKIKELPNIIKNTGENVLIITGAKSFLSSDKWKKLQEDLSKKKIKYNNVMIQREPSPKLVDTIAAEYRNKSVDIVISIGGGSCIDAGKAVSAMLTQEDSISNYLEDIGRKKHPGNKVPFIAIPTTAGTGSEATKNAVLSITGSGGYKKSIRHDNFIPDIALVDPELAVSCPKNITASCGMDAITQLLEAYVSNKSNVLTDALCLSGIEEIKDSLNIASEKPDNIEARTSLCYASLISGIVLANAGLGIVHGLASPIGSLFDVPHGIVCGTLIGAATKINIEKLKINEPDNPALIKYAKVGSILSGTYINYTELCLKRLVDKLDEWIKILEIPALGKYNIHESDFNKIIKEGGQKNNPINLTPNDIKKILSLRL